MNFKRLAIGVLALSAWATSALATQTIYFGENQSAPGTLGPEPAAAQASFLSKLIGVGTETFESFDVFTRGPLSLTFPGASGSIEATLKGSGQVENRLGVGRFNTSPAGGTQWWDSGSQFSIDFDTPIAAFGFYGTDIGDFAGQVTVELVDIADRVTTLTIPNTVSGVDGAALFWGFIDTDTAYKRLSFGNTAAGFDGFGFDGLIVGEQAQVIPEPATAILFAFGLLALAPLLRRR
jgi:hypothetical protein